MDLALNNLQRLICHKTQQTKPIKLFSLHLCGLFSTDIFTLSHPAANPQKVARCPLTSACCVRSRNINFRLHHACTQDFRPPVFLSHFWPCYSVTTVCFIYWFNFLWAIHLRYTNTNQNSRQWNNHLQQIQYQQHICSILELVEMDSSDR